MKAIHNRFLVSSVVLLAMLLGYNVAIRLSARHSQRRHMLHLLEALPAATDCIFLGNSLVEAGCDVSAFQARWSERRPDVSLVPANLALGATTPVEHYLILKRALQNKLHLKFLIYGFFDDQLNAAASGNWSDLVGNRAFSYYFPNEAAALYAPGSSTKRWQLWAAGHIPMLAERSSLWGKVELLRRDLDEIGLPRHKTNRFGRVDDFSGLESADLPSFDRRCGAILRNHQGFSPSIQGIIRLARENGARIILLEMPMPSRHRNIFYSSPVWVELRSRLQTLAGTDQAVYLSASDWVPDDRMFEDATHLTEQGATFFSEKLAAAISAWPSEPKELANAGAR